MSSDISVLISREETRLVQRITNYVIKTYPTIIEGGLLLTKEDLLHYGIQGLLEAKSTFDKTKKIPWLAFASFRVKGAMLDHIRKLPMIKLSHGCYAKIKQMERTRGDLLKKHGSASHSQMASILKWPLEEINSVLNLAQVLKPVQQLEGTNSEDFNRHNAANAAMGSSAEDILIRKELLKQLACCLQDLDELDCLILTSRTIAGTKLRELAARLSCSAENIRLRQKKAEKQVQDCLNKNNWPAEKCLEVIQ